MFIDQIRLVNGRQLEVILEKLNSYCWISRLRRQGVRKDRSGSLAQRNRKLAAGHSGVDERIVDRGTAHASEVKAVAAANRIFPVTVDVPGEADARPKIVLVAWHSSGLRDSGIGQERLRELLVFPTHADIKRKPLVHAEVVLKEKVIVVGVQ